MIQKSFRCIFTLGCLFTSAFVLRAANPGVLLTNAFPGLTFTNPVCSASPPGENNRLFIVEKKGLIVVITNLGAPNRTIYMNITAVVTNDVDTNVGGEEGCLGLAFHPGYATNGFFYVFYTGLTTTPGGSGRHDILSRFRVSASNPNQGDPASEVRYIVQYDQAYNHNAGDLHFGADGYLYVSLGDEGGSFGQYGNTQRIDRDFFSAIMRIDVDKRAGSLTPNPHTELPSLTNYAIPPDNPYVGATNFNGLSVNSTNVRTEFWAVGMRNPWRFSFDSANGDLYLGHVGQNLIEWVNIVTNGANCGWNYYEGSQQWTNPLPVGFTNYAPQIAQYGHTNGRNCIIGGIVYRGAFIPQLYAAYLYADYGSGEVFALRYAGGVVTQNSPILTNSGAHFTAFGIDPSTGDPLISSAKSGTNGIIQRIISAVPVKIPRFTGVSLSGTNLILSGTNGSPTQTYYLLASSNLTQSLTSWPPVATSLFDSSGNFIVTNPLSHGFNQRFYRIQVP